MKHSDRSLFRLAGWILLNGCMLLPALFMGVLIYRHGVDTPYYDDWNDTVPLFAKMARGALGWQDFFAQNAEHRLVFPRLIFFAIGKLFQWNIRIELAVMFALVVAIFSNIYLIAKYHSFESKTGLTLFGFATAFLLFNPLHHDNFLTGYSVGFMLLIAPFTACLWIVPKARYPFNIAWAASLCALATFSLASGIITWLFVAPLLCMQEGRWDKSMVRRALPLHFGCAFLAGFLYLYDYHPVGNSTLEIALARPWKAALYFVVYLGGPFCYGTPLEPTAAATFTGVFLLLFFTACAAYLLLHRKNDHLLLNATPCLLLAAFILLNDASTVLGRLKFGITQARTSRYLIFPSLFAVALLALFPIVYKHLRETYALSRVANASIICFFSIAAAFLAVMNGAGFLERISQFELMEHGRLYSRALVAACNVLDDPAQREELINLPASKLQEYAKALHQLHYLRPALMESDAMENIADLNEKPSGAFGTLLMARRINDQGAFGGTAILPQKHRPADAVILSWEDSHNKPRMFAIGYTDQPTPSLVKQYGDDAYTRCGWVKQIPVSQVPRNAARLRAWAYDAESGRAYPIFDGR